MSPRFSGRQYPGAMKDHRARKRDEAAARQQQPRPHAFSAFVKACNQVMEAVAKVFTSPPTQADFALVPDGLLDGSASGTAPRYDLGGALPAGITRVRNDTGRPERVFTREEWETIQRQVRGEQ